MSTSAPSSGPPDRLRRTTAATRAALVEASRWQRVELDVIRMTTAGAAVGLPLGIGVWSGEVGPGVVATIGALMLSSSGHVGNVSDRVGELLTSAVAGCLGMVIGTALGDLSNTDAVLVVLGAVLVTAVGTMRANLTKATMQFVVNAIVGTTIAQIAMSPPQVAAYFTTGALLAAVLTLGGYAAARRLTRLPAPEGAEPGSLREDLRAWRHALGAMRGWVFPLRLGSCLAVAMVFVLLLSGTHSTWVALTVVIVVQPDRDAALARTVQRGLGTVLGVVLGAIMLTALPLWVMVAAATAVGAVRGHLKAVNYTAYALVMTPLVVIITGLSHPATDTLLVERVGDTVLGCLISLAVGHWLWGLSASEERGAQES